MYKKSAVVPDPTSCFWGPYVVPKTFPLTQGDGGIFFMGYTGILGCHPRFLRFFFVAGKYDKQQLISTCFPARPPPWSYLPTHSTGQSEGSI